MARVGVGIIGCGNISTQYLKAMSAFDGLEIIAVADMKADVAERKAAEFGLVAGRGDALLADPRVTIIVNLTIPRAHVAVGLKAIAAGKHVYSEKPLGINFAEGKALLDAATKAGLRVGSAPDTFLGGGHQQVRALIDSGAAGRIVGGTATFACPGHERWHPDPAFYYDIGGGPVLDMGPYYITDLVQLLGPVESVMAMSGTPRPERPILSEPKRGQMMPVHVATHVSGLLRFHSGAIIQVLMSFDVPAHAHTPIELYGEKLSVLVPDPNMFGGPVKTRAPGETDWTEVPVTAPFADANYRSLGVADMAHAISTGRPHRASGDLALHVLEVMEALDIAARERREVAITTPVTRPEPLSGSVQTGQFR